MSIWHSQRLYSSTLKSYNYSMWSLHGSVLPRLMSFPKAWMLLVFPIPSFLAPRLALLMGLMANWALENQVSFKIDCGCMVCTRLCMHVHFVHPQVAFCSHLEVCTLCSWKWGFLHITPNILTPLCDCAVAWLRPCWHCVRFTPGDCEQVSDRDKLSGSIHQKPTESALVRLGSVRLEQAGFTLSAQDQPNQNHL